MTGSKRRAIIIGGSMAGLTAALHLQRRGWDVSVYERATTPLSGRGAGIVTHPELRAGVAALGLDATHDFGVPIAGRSALERDGQLLGEIPYPQISTSWNRLFQILRAGFGEGRYHLGKDLVAFEDDGPCVTARFADGSAAQGELLVGADGFRSAVRAQMMPNVQPDYAGYVAWRGMLEEAIAAPLLSPHLFARFVFALPPAEQFLGYPVAGPNNDLRAGNRSWNIVWYRPTDEASELPRLLTDETGKRHELSIPPTLIARTVREEMLHAARTLLPPQLSAVMERIEMPLLQPIYDLETPRMVQGRVALIGDAAFVVRPHVGAGVTKAADDAAALAEALDSHAVMPEALAAFEAKRLAMGRLFIARARRLGSHIKRRFASPEEEAAAAINADPAYAMAETAQLDFLRRVPGT
jgi:2-polyprenyl-6-methoxyphenol hydroxylase-like FAD-dependent oxidoreductase